MTVIDLPFLCSEWTPLSPDVLDLSCCNRRFRLQRSQFAIQMSNTTARGRSASRRPPGCACCASMTCAHSFGSLVVRELDTATLKSWMGHSKLTTTERYLHAKPRHLACTRWAFVSSTTTKGAMVHTDGWPSYNGLTKLGYDHRPRSQRAEPGEQLLLRSMRPACRGSWQPRSPPRVPRECLALLSSQPRPQRMRRQRSARFVVLENDVPSLSNCSAFLGH